MSYIEELDSENLLTQVPEEIEADFLSRLKLELLDMVRANEAKRVLLNFSAVKTISSRHLSELFSLKFFFKVQKLEVAAINVNERVLSILKSVGFDQVFDMEIKGDFSSVSNARIPLEQQLVRMQEELSYQRELYNRVTKDLELKLHNAREDLKKMNEQIQLYDKSNSIGELAAGVAHEFNNIIGGILGYAQLAQMKRTDEVVDKALNSIVKLSKRVEGITTGLLNFSRKKPVKLMQIDLGEVIDGVLAFTRKQLENHKIKVVTKLMTTDKFYADEHLISQVILNLVINASHAMEQGGVLTISLLKMGNNAVVSVRDTGVGIKRNQIDKIFQPFFTTKGALGGGSKSGTGLGLSVSRNIIEMHGGTLVAESEEGKGACFTISLPINNGLKQEPESMKKDVFTSSKIEHARFLIIDDEEMIRQLMYVVLTDQGHDVFVGVNGEEAIQLYNAHKPDLIFLDVLMPRMNGLDAFLEIKKDNPNAKVVFITGQAGEYLEKILDSLVGSKEVYLLRKPFEIKDVLNIIDVALSNNES